MTHKPITNKDTEVCRFYYDMVWVCCKITSKQMIPVPHTKHRQEFGLVRAPSSLTSLEDVLQSQTLDKIRLGVRTQTHTFIRRDLPWHLAQPGPRPLGCFHHARPATQKKSQQFKSKQSNDGTTMRKEQTSVFMMQERLFFLFPKRII